MTLDEAISHALEVAEQEEQLSKTGKWFEGEDWNKRARGQCAECAADHRQLAEWLRELKEAKRLLKAAINDFELPKDCRICNPKKAWNCIPDKIQCLPDGLFKEFEWRHKAEALKLIGETNDEP